MSGVSGGALNAVLLSNFTAGQEDAAADRMEQFWLDGTHSKLYQSWWGGILRGLFWRGGIYDSSPMLSYLKGEFSNVNLQRDVDIGIVDI